MINNPIPAVEVNILGALNVFDAIRMHKKRGFQIAVGNYWMNNPYSITKNTAERFALMYNKEHGTDIRVLRGMNVYGERQKHRPIRKIFPNLVIPAILGKDITIYGTGEQVMDLVYVKDIAEVIARVLLTPDIPNDIIYECGVGGGMTINKAVDIVLKGTNSTSKVNRVAMRPGEDKMSVVEISEEGWQNLDKYVHYSKDNLTPLDEAMQKSIDWYAKNIDLFPWDE
jgi:nucleoside-diphosphate-sugar epimerase